MPTKENFIQEEFELYQDSVKHLQNAVMKEYGSRAILGYVLLDKDKHPKQCMNSSMFPLTEKAEIAKYNSMSVLPSNIKQMNGIYYKKATTGFWGKHTKKSILEILSKKELGDLNALGTGKYFMVSDIDTKNINESTPSLTECESIQNKTLIVKTPSGGKHYIYLLKKDSKSNQSYSFPCIDILGKGKLVVAPRQQREGYGMYEFDTENPNFSWDIAYWDDSITIKTKELFSRYSVSPTQPNLRSNSSPYSMSLHLSQNAGKTAGLILEGSRFRTLQSIAGGLVHLCKSENEFFSKLLQIRNSRMENPLTFKDSEVRAISKGIWNKEEQKRISNSSPYSMSLHLPRNAGKVTESLLRLLDGLKKEEVYSSKLVDIAPVIKEFFDRSFGNKNSKPMKLSAAGGYLSRAGFKNKQIQRNGVRSMLWNISEESLNQLKDKINQMEIKIKPQPEISLKAQESPQASEATITQPARETKSELILEPSASIPEPVSAAEAQDNIKENIIEALLEINKATNVTPIQRKQYFVEVCDLINYSIWKDLPKHIQNLIPTDQIIKIIRRR